MSSLIRLFVPQIPSRSGAMNLCTTIHVCSLSTLDSFICEPLPLVMSVQLSGCRTGEIILLSKIVPLHLYPDKQWPDFDVKIIIQSIALAESSMNVSRLIEAKKKFSTMQQR